MPLAFPRSERSEAFVASCILAAVALSPLDTDAAVRLVGLLRDAKEAPLLVRLDLERADPLLVGLEEAELLEAERFEADFDLGPVVTYRLTRRGEGLLAALGH